MSQSSPDNPFRDYAAYLRERYGKTVRRVPLDLGLSCPNRDGDGTGGCAFCGEAGARAAHLAGGRLSLAEQVRRGVAAAREQHPGEALMAYFQAFTSTHAPAATLRPLFAEALAGGDFRCVSVATRPDCLPEETLDLLAELARSHDLQVELGVQTVHDRTLEAMGRGHDAACSERAVRALAARGIPVVPHIILGLPGESREMFRETAQRLAGWPCAGIKIHNLHILEGSRLAAAWRAGEIETMDEHEYGEALIDVLRRIPAAWPIQRLASDTPPALLLAPKWWLGKEQFRQYVVRRMLDKGWRQGDLLNPAPGRDPAKTQPMRRPKAEPPRRERIDAGGPLSAAVRIPASLPEQSLAVLDIGFGLNTLMPDLLPLLQAGAGSGRIRLAAFGEDRSLVRALRKRHPEYDRQLAILGAGLDLCTPGGSATAHWGDPRRHIFRVRGRAHVILLEPRVVECNVTLFSQDFLRRVTRLLRPDGVLLAGSSDPALRGALLRLGLAVGTPAPDLAADGTVAAWDATLVLHPLAAEDLRAATRAPSCVPYRDRDLTWPGARIQAHRDAVLERLRRGAAFLARAKIPCESAP